MRKSVIAVLGFGLSWGFVFGGFKPARNENAPKGALSSAILEGLEFRNLNPTIASGRISDLAVNPNDPSVYYVGTAGGGVWKTVNAGTSFFPVFDDCGSSSIGAVAIDPNNPNVVWVGTGEAHAIRSVAYGDGVYRSDDAGKTWKNMGLADSFQIGKIAIDPRNSHVYVAAQGSLWGPGGDRGLYRTSDGGRNWKKILTISENTGVNDVVIDPGNPDILYAAAWQRRRHVFTLVYGGPESAVFKSIDAGETWTKLADGLPAGDIGRIGLAVSPACPDVVYAVIEAAGGESGLYRSSDRGASWMKTGDGIAIASDFYNRIFADPKAVDKVYSMDSYAQVTEDGGGSWRLLDLKNRHFDDHALWIDPENTNHLILGGDGGIYVTFDGGLNWEFKNNLPVTQCYRVSVDNALPFYHVYTGTQDNDPMGGPSRTVNAYGIVNNDWFILEGGDGFFIRSDPENPDIVYVERHNGRLFRYDRKSGERLRIQPHTLTKERYRWNWNSPLIVSPHPPTHLYYGANTLFRSDDRGNSWKVVSPDLTRQLDRNTLPVMGKIQGPDALGKHFGTSPFGNIVSLSESPLKEGLLYAGTDDGLIQVSADSGATWQKIDRFPGIPEMTYVSCLWASQHHADRVYATFDGHKNNDMAPHVMRSDDRGRSWTSLASNLPSRGTVFSIAEDHIDPDLLFVGTHFGLFCTVDGGRNWVRLNAGLPTCWVQDIAVQKREDDLVIATFGRGVYVLDNYAPLRELRSGVLDKEAHLFSTKEAQSYIESPWSYTHGENDYVAENPPFGATFTYYLKESVLGRRVKREREDRGPGLWTYEDDSGEEGDIPSLLRTMSREPDHSGIQKKKTSAAYPTSQELQSEEDEEVTYLLFTISDESGNVVRKLRAPAKAGIHRITWDLRFPSVAPVEAAGDPFENRRGIFLVPPGRYAVSLSQCVDGDVSDLGEAGSFNVEPLNNSTLPAKDRRAMAEFHKKILEFVRAASGAENVAGQALRRIECQKEALQDAPVALKELLNQLMSLKVEVKQIIRALNADETLEEARFEPRPPAISDRILVLLLAQQYSTSEPTETMKDQYRLACEEFEPLLQRLTKLVETDLRNVEKKMEEARAPATPGRIPVWKK